jgi:hypothetical protein
LLRSAPRCPRPPPQIRLRRASRPPRRSSRCRRWTFGHPGAALRTRKRGVLTKITLKNQVDDLLDQFRAYYQGKLKITLAELRRSFDLLVQKVLSLLQDSDQSLAMAIVASRDALWGILSDPKKFATI